ncbi:MAG TPA: dolichyl-phosphate beta-glucosyltransferase [Candidatus Nanoarchaeia archaeon]|nr:dolichyl-phosphate beta-glucosyltransferase [Candidatus Nanoarchaeia archaeon]
MDIEYSIIIPAYNEEKIISNTIEETTNFLKKTNKSFELIISNDGSKDRTAEIVKNKQKNYKELKLCDNQKNEGKGSALTNAFKMAKGRYILFIDADLAIDINLFPKLIEPLKKNTADIAIASKHVKGASVEYSLIRSITSRTYSALARIILGLKIKDCQCGFKAFRKETIKKILPDMKNKGWGWDTEVLAKASWKGYKIIEVPAKVVNIPGRESKVSIIKTVKSMLKELIELQKEKKKYAN